VERRRRFAPAQPDLEQYRRRDRHAHDLGTYNFTARVTDSASNSVTKALAITVVSPTLSITTEELPDSIVGATYSKRSPRPAARQPTPGALCGAHCPAA